MEQRDVVWWTRLDGRYGARVEETGDYTCVLEVTEGEEILYAEEVALSYGALLGPDVGDIADWQEKAVRVVDEKTATEEGS